MNVINKQAQQMHYIHINKCIQNHNRKVHKLRQQHVCQSIVCSFTLSRLKSYSDSLQCSPYTKRGGRHHSTVQGNVVEFSQPCLVSALFSGPSLLEMKFFSESFFPQQLYRYYLKNNPILLETCTMTTAIKNQHYCTPTLFCVFVKKPNDRQTVSGLTVISQ